MLQIAFRPSCMNGASVFERHKRFKEGSESVRDDERCGRSKEVYVKKIQFSVNTVSMSTYSSFSNNSV